MTRVAVVGDALIDVMVAPQRPIRRGGDVPAAVRLEPGGQGANIAVRLARRGVAVRLACALGDDTAGRLLRESLDAERVELRPVLAAETGAVAVLVEADGERTMLSRRIPLAATLDLRALVADAGWLLVSGYVLLEPNVAELARAVAALPLHRALVGCALEPAEAAAWMATATLLTPDLVILNEAEARVLGDALSALPAAVVVTTDASGAVSSSAGDLTRVERSSEPARDTTGAGDAFAAALVAQLRDAPWPPDAAALRTAMRGAAELASAVTSVAGAQGRVSGEREPRART